MKEQFLDYLKPGIISGKELQKLFTIDKKKYYELSIENLDRPNSFNEMHEIVEAFNSPIIIQPIYEGEVLNTLNNRLSESKKFADICVNSYAMSTCTSPKFENGTTKSCVSITDLACRKRVMEYIDENSNYNKRIDAWISTSNPLTLIETNESNATCFFSICEQIKMVKLNPNSPFELYADIAQCTNNTGCSYYNILTHFNNTPFSDNSDPTLKILLNKDKSKEKTGKSDGKIRVKRNITKKYKGNNGRNNDKRNFALYNRFQIIKENIRFLLLIQLVSLLIISITIISLTSKNMGINPIYIFSHALTAMIGILASSIKFRNN